jgi:small subunit ribosomal protein S6
MNFYETVSILRQDTSNQGVKAFIDECTRILVSMGANVIKCENWGLLTFAYPIKRNKRGHYIALYIQASPDAIIELERNYKIKDNVLRFMTIRTKKIDLAPSPMMQLKNGQDTIAENPLLNADVSKAKIEE